MDEKIDDKSVILIILATILLIFLLIFNFLPSQDLNNPSIQWKEPTSNGTQSY